MKSVNEKAGVPATCRSNFLWNASVVGIDILPHVAKHPTEEETTIFSGGA
jgi:hypothetical protein